MENNFDIHKWQAKYLKEVTGEALDRIDGMIERPLLVKFLYAFDEIVEDFYENGEEFNSSDIIEYLTMIMHERAGDTRTSYI